MDNWDALTTVTQGSIGLTSAIYNLTRLGYTVSVPIIDNQKYDLIADKDNVISRVEVKTTRTKSESGNFIAQIRSVRSNKTANKVIDFDNSIVDILYILTSENDNYLIPANEIDVKTAITLGPKYSKYKI